MFETQIQAAGASIHVLKRGSGDPLLLLHGYPQTHVMWHKIAPREAGMQQKVRCPLLALWGEQGFIGRKYDVLATWRERSDNVQGYALPSGHFLPEEAPEETYQALQAFLLHN